MSTGKGSVGIQHLPPSVLRSKSKSVLLVVKEIENGWEVVGNGRLLLPFPEKRAGLQDSELLSGLCGCKISRLAIVQADFLLIFVFDTFNPFSPPACVIWSQGVS